MVDFLKYSWDLFGIKAPWFSWIAAFALILWPAWELIKLSIIYRKQSKNLDLSVNHINVIGNEHPIRLNEGFPPAAIEKFRDYFKKIPVLITPWNSYEKCLIFRRNGDGDGDSVWSTESAASSFNDDSVFESGFNKRFFLSIPGIVTGTGLLFTFLAILVALIDVNIDQSGQVKGLDLLIGGLSGKFVSSVAAIFSATLFLSFEKSIFHKLSVKRKRFIASIDNLIPRISPIQLLVEIQRDTSGQSDAFRMFSADLATKMKNSLDESMGPILERMVNAIDDLNQFMRSANEDVVSLLKHMNDLLKEAETGKQETITDQLRTLLAKVENSITTALSDMGKNFNESLSGSARDQFNRMAETMGSTARVLENMNSQFEHSQQALKEMVNLSKENYEKQISVGQSQIENLTAVLNTVGNEMKKTIEDTSLKSSQEAKGIISEVSNLSAENAERLRLLLEKHGTELSRVEDLNVALQNTLINFDNSIHSYSQVTTDLKQISGDVKTVVSQMSQVSNTMREGQDSIKQIAIHTKSQIQSLADANEMQQAVWQRIHKSMEDYEQLFNRVENNSKTLVNEISRNLEAYNSATRSGFEKILSTANDTLGNAVGCLSSSILDLQNLLEDLSEEIEKFNSSNRRQR